MDWIIVASAGFLGGILNAVAGGGSFITLPALIFVGVPPVSANATGTAALLPGYLASAWRFRRDLELPAQLSAAQLALLAVAGGGLGAMILLISSEQAFSRLIPWLILFATIAFLVGPWLVQRRAANTEHRSTPHRLQTVKTAFVLFGVCVYGGYFNGGLGIILLATLGLLGQTNLHGMNGLKNSVSALLTAIAVMVYTVGGTLSVEYLVVLGLAAMSGGYVGAAFAYRIPQHILRAFIISIGGVMAVIFFVKTG